MHKEFDKLPFQEGTGAADPDIIDTMNYRGYDVTFYIDTVEQQYFAIISNYMDKIPLGFYNTNYKKEIKHLIDKDLDTIYVYKKYPGAFLTLFNNNGYYDAQLTYHNRVIDIALLDMKRPDASTDRTKLMADLQYLIDAGAETLDKYAELMQDK